MDDLKAALRDAFESDGYEIAELSTNRKQVRIAVRDAEASGEQLRELTHGVIDADDVLGFNVQTESTATDEITTVVSFRYRG